MDNHCLNLQLSSPAPVCPELDKLREALSGASAVILGAGAGCSASAGFDYAGERFQHYFSDFENRYGFHDMYAGGFYPYPSPETYWAFWSRNVMINRYQPAPKPVYEQLFSLIGEKDYFVVTTNVDHQFQKAGFDKTRLFYMQGDYGLFQCSAPCCQKTYDNRDVIFRMVEEQRDLRIPSDLIPKCPVCGRPMTMNLRIDDRFVEDSGWHRAAERYDAFLRSHEDKAVLFLELGVGYNTPTLIKYPFWRMTARNPRALYACINAGEAVCPKEIERQAICMETDIGSILPPLLKTHTTGGGRTS